MDFIALSKRKGLCFRQKLTTYPLIGFLLIPDPIEVSNESLPTALAGMIESSRGLVIKLSL